MNGKKFNENSIRGEIRCTQTDYILYVDSGKIYAEIKFENLTKLVRNINRKVVSPIKFL